MGQGKCGGSNVRKDENDSNGSGHGNGNDGQPMRIKEPSKAEVQLARETVYLYSISPFDLMCEAKQDDGAKPPRSGVIGPTRVSPIARLVCDRACVSGRLPKAVKKAQTVCLLAAG